MASSVLDRLKILISTNADEFKAQLGKIDRSINGLNKNMTNLARGVGLTFGAFEAGRILKDVIVDSITLAAETEGVENAFNKLNRPGLLSQLQGATRGTLNNLELMRSAVEFDNFKLPLEQLGTLMQFVQLRSEQTGKSVELLRESLVEGLAKGSLRRLDNLGFSIIELKKGIEEFGDVTGAVASLAQREIEKMGTEADTAKTRMNQFTASMDNLKISLGKIANDGVVSDFFKNLNDDIKRLNKTLDRRSSNINNAESLKSDIDEIGRYINFLEFFGVKQEKIIELTAEQKSLVSEYTKVVDEFRKSFNVPLSSSLVPSLENPQENQIGAIQKLQKELKDLVDKQPTVTKAALPAINQRIKAIQEEIKTLKSLGIQSDDVAKQLKTQFEESKKLLDELSQTLDSRGTFKILRAANDGDFSVLQNGITDEFDDSVLKGNEQLALSLNKTISRIRLQQEALQEAGFAGQVFTDALTGGLSQVLGLLFQTNKETSKLERILFGVTKGLLGSLVAGPGGLISGLVGKIFNPNANARLTSNLGQINSIGKDTSIPNDLLSILGKRSQEPQVLLINSKLEGADIHLSLKRINDTRNRNFAG